VTPDRALGEQVEALTYPRRVTATSPRRLPTIASSSRREQVADVLRDAITDGTLEPGERLTEIGLSTQFGTSRAPVREALRQLEQEGLVISYPYRGTEVLGVSQEEIEQVLVPVRVTLERFAFVKAAERLTPDDVDRLNALVDDMASAAEDPGRLADDDVAFHKTVMTLSGQPHCLQIWSSLQPRVKAYFRRDAAYYDDPRVVAEQHRELLRALESRDAAVLEAAVTDHIHLHFKEPDQR
jgi:DNA-binding GntR family transcriptional regulator